MPDSPSSQSTIPDGLEPWLEIRPKSSSPLIELDGRKLRRLLGDKHIPLIGINRQTTEALHRWRFGWCETPQQSFDMRSNQR